jgi:hypothetical protein
LLAAQDKALALFDMIGQELIRSGITEGALTEEIYGLVAERFGVTNHWHKRVVRTGPHTLMPYAENPGDRIAS